MFEKTSHTTYGERVSVFNSTVLRERGAAALCSVEMRDVCFLAIYYYKDT